MCLRKLPASALSGTRCFERGVAGFDLLQMAGQPLVLAADHRRVSAARSSSSSIFICGVEDVSFHGLVEPVVGDGAGHQHDRQPRVVEQAAEPQRFVVDDR